MQVADLTRIEAAYDKVGKYNQDVVNGFSEQMIYSMLDFVHPGENMHILDAMAGNGNLTSRLYQYCHNSGIAFPNVTILELSRVQCEFAREQLAGTPTEVICGDILTMQDLERGTVLPSNAFDRVMIKSASHEIPLHKQLDMYRNIFRVLKPGGMFINMGFLYDDVEERDEFRELARLKDSRAGLHSAAENRHFLTRDELYSRLHEAGFMDVYCGKEILYKIRTRVGVQAYFPEHQWDAMQAALQADQAKAVVMRRNGHLPWQGDSSVLICPGEITVARRLR